MKKSKIGHRGENQAIRYLEDLGWEILARNWRSGRREIDIIARDGDQLVFLEVKTRRSILRGHPIEYIDARKQEFMVEAATQYLAQAGWDGEFRFDLIGIVDHPQPPTEITHVRDAFFPFF